MTAITQAPATTDPDTQGLPGGSPFAQPVAEVTNPDLLVGRLFGDPSAAGNPYPIYHRLRELAPVHHSRTGHWVVSRYRDVEHVIRQKSVGKDVEAFISAQGVPDWRSHPSFTRMLEHLIWLNPPVHTHRRGLLNKVFTPRAVRGWQPKIEERVTRLLDSVAAGGDVDLLDALAFPLPVAVIGTLLGIPQEDWPRFRRLFRDVTLCVEPSPTAKQIAVSDAAALELNAYFEDLIIDRRRTPRDDLTSELVQAEESGERMGVVEMSSLLQFLFGAGFETTTNLIGNGLLGLLRSPGQLRDLQANPALLANAVEEMLRFDCSVQLTMRTAKEDLDVAGHTIPAGQSMLLLLGAANRDPARFANPDAIDVRRDDPRSISFGGGIHYCIGAGLARLEGQIAMRELLRRFDRIELLDPEPPWKTNLTLHGLNQLPVRLTPAGR